MKKRGFTIIELIFAIVIIGILAAVALPKFAETRNVVEIQKVKEEISKVKMGIQNKVSDNLISGENKCPDLEQKINDNTVFENVLNKGINKNDSDIIWENNTENKYKITFTNNKSFKFEYDNNISLNCPLKCSDNNSLCKEIIEK